MLTAAREAIDLSPHKPLLVAVTVLTSLTDGDLESIGLHGPISAAVLRLAQLSKACGLDGVVCSGKEAAALRTVLGQEFKLITPGIRPVGADHDDQARVMTPEKALGLGADYLVIGRPITQAADPMAQLAAINNSVSTFIAGSQ